MRWQPDGRGRLELAALELYLEQGFESTTVAEIAERAGLSERTFFRHFADKREVLFPGGDTFENLIAEAALAAPVEFGPLDAAFAGLEAVGVFLKERRSFAQKRQRIISATPELQERELIKLQSVATKLQESLLERGSSAPVAGLVAEVAVAVFKTSFETWIRAKNTSDLTTVLRSSLQELREATALSQ
ncbi:MAG TPA: helix-turn-helix domain-containing protein [Acidimicrobiales bacterium]|jgi:AcrR family transcriptional regulator